MRARADMPSGHGELVLQPPDLDEWAELAVRNSALAETWEFEVGNVPARTLRAHARAVLSETARDATDRLGLPVAGPSAGPVIVTGHQPEIYHAGVWVKDFALQHVATCLGGTGIDLVVDSDVFEEVGLTAPCLGRGERLTRCRHLLVLNTSGACFACTPVPSPGDIDDFCTSTVAALATLHAPAIGTHFHRFCDALRMSAEHSTNLAELITGARRRFEGDLTDYLELPVTELSLTEPFRRFATDILLDAKRFADAYNSELAEYRALSNLRSSAQPFPDLKVTQDAIEIPFWVLGPEGRAPAFVVPTDNSIELRWARERLVLPQDTDGALAVLGEAEAMVVPRAVTLTLFARAFLADLFIHGIGGDRYDRVTEGVARRWWGIDLPPFAVASLTMYLPLGAAPVNEEDIAQIEQRLHRLVHNPDESLGEVVFESAEERRAARMLVEEKRALVDAISRPGADRSTLGLRIKGLNRELA
ncbi:MAG: hypothetical protein RBS78_09125, partial [Coriobacteriia bacterium]|nr:hypothetical protein [Coriobacteriia bacterium]